MVISKRKMIIKLEEDVNKLNEEIEELIKLRDVLINSSEYKQLYGKTQMIGNSENTEIRSRLEHSQNIAITAKNVIGGIYEACATEAQKRTAIYKLNRIKEMMYVEICSLAHDLGHTPFGHSGEKSVNEFVQTINDKEQIDIIIKKRIECFGEQYEEEQGHIGDEIILSFEHNEQSALIFYDLLNNSGINTKKVDVKKLINAILSHSTTRVTKCPKDLVAQMVRQGDKIEYRIMDYTEVGKYIRPDKFRNREYLDLTPKQLFKKIEEELIEEAIEKGEINDQMEALEGLKLFRKEYDDSIYFLEDGRKGLLTQENVERNRLIVSKLLRYYYDNVDKITFDKSIYPVKPINSNVEEKIYSVYNGSANINPTKLEIVLKYVLSMDNKKAERQYLKLVKQRVMTGKGVNPNTPEEIEEIRISQEDEKVRQIRAKEFMKTTQPHTVQEIRNIVRTRDNRFIKEMLTEEGIRAINETKRKIEKDSAIDYELCEQMERADTSRKYGKRRISTNRIDKILGCSITEKEKRERAKTIVKNNWIYVEGVSEQEEGDYEIE